MLVRSRRNLTAIFAVTGVTAAGAAAGAPPAAAADHVLAAEAAAPAATDAAPWRCHAGALSGTVLGQAVEPVRAGSTTGPCPTERSMLSAPLPAPLSAAAVVAATSADDRRALASAGVADLRIASLPTLPVQLPEAAIPAGYAALTVPLPPVPLLGLLPSSVTVDLRPAIDALLPDRRLPALELLRVQGAVAHAAGQCTGGSARLAGAPSVAGISVGGRPLSTGQAVDATVPLLDSASIDLSDLDLSLVAMPVVTGISEEALRPIVEAALDPILDTLPDIQVPGALARVKVTPGGQTTTAGVLTQRALDVQVSIAGEPIADLAVGSAAIADAGADCAGPATPTELALQCTDRKVVLIDVLRRGRRVQLLGAADPAFAGRRAEIVFGATGGVVARATVQRDGSFETTAPLPPKRVRATNRARYRAVVAGERSLNLKLRRRMILTATRSGAGRVTITGRVVRPLARPRAEILLRRRLDCNSMEVVARLRPRRDGRFSVTVDAPAGETAAVYRLTTRVRKNRRSRGTFRTFTLPRFVELR